MADARTQLEQPATGDSLRGPAQPARALPIPGAYRLRLPEGIGVAAGSVPEQTLKELIRRPERPLEPGRHVVVKRDAGTFLVRTELALAETTVAVAYKRIRSPKLWKRWLAPLRRSRALRAWRLGHELLSRGVATARPLAAVVTRRWGRDAYLVNEWIEGAASIYFFYHALDNADSRFRRVVLRNAARSLGTLLGRMHQCGFRHRDLKVGNVLMVLRGEAVEAYLVDLDGVTAASRVSRHLRRRNLKRLAESVYGSRLGTTTDYVRFLKAYFRAAGEPAGDWKPVWRAFASELRGTPPYPCALNPESY